MNSDNTDESMVNFDDDIADDLDANQDTSRFQDAVLYGTDWTVKTILQQIEEGNIDLAPDFQRRDAWSSKNKSRFIESVALLLPIPQIVLAEKKEKRGTYLVLDGKQRLLTLAQFAGQLPPEHPLWNEFSKTSHLKLSGLKVLSSLNSKTYEDISEDPASNYIKTQFDNHTIRSALIRNWPDEDYLYEVFIRLNTGSARLSPQELRQAMKPGLFTAFIGERSAESKILQEVLGLGGPDFRMRDVDLLLRLVAFLTRLQNYKGNLKPFLDDAHEHFNANWDAEEDQIKDLVARIEDALSLLSKWFGGPKMVGRRLTDGVFEGPVNRAVLDVQVASALDPAVRDAVNAGKVDFKHLFMEMFASSPEFVRAVSGTTKSIEAIRHRYREWQSALERAIGAPVQMPRLP